MTGTKLTLEDLEGVLPGAEVAKVSDAEGAFMVKLADDQCRVRRDEEGGRVVVTSLVVHDFDDLVLVQFATSPPSGSIVGGTMADTSVAVMLARLASTFGGRRMTGTTLTLEDLEGVLPGAEVGKVPGTEGAFGVGLTDDQCRVMRDEEGGRVVVTNLLVFDHGDIVTVHPVDAHGRPLDAASEPVAVMLARLASTFGEVSE